MSDIAMALAPILVLILIGYSLKRSHFLPDDAWSGMEKLTYFVLFPALLVRTLGNQSLAGAPWSAMLLVVVGTLLLAAALLIAWRQFGAAVDGATFTSIFQGGVRFNTYIALAVAQAFFVVDGLAMGAVTAGFMIVLINLLCISAFAVWGTRSRKGWKPIIRDVIGNPLILACALGWLLSLSGIGVPGIAEDILEIIGRAALPFGLLAVGAALKPEAVRGHIGPILVSSIIQFGLKPTATALLIVVTGLSGVPAGALAICFMVPTAPSAYILARQLGGDTAAMASIITFQTLLAFLVMPFIALLLL
ncbi:AEC family transporter [Sedimenticola selenatireducens]|uniref:AEC family transporter n=1 Tax=Sedimenticola selenatireducens TaxID=191960 RepID=A0A2N6CVA2_9GAMM|nr:AEC family transporter [Sedimenticola selenatireducens]PLX61136.1 MAG: AEC family transporter [Sedimenticola selenatireducens]